MGEDRELQELRLVVPAHDCLPRKSTRGLVMSAMPMLTRLAWPPEMPRSRALQRVGRTATGRRAASRWDDRQLPAQHMQVCKGCMST